MNPVLFTAEFMLLSGIQIFSVVFSLIVFVNGLKRYWNTDKSEVFLRKSIKYFSFILLTIACAAGWALFVNIRRWKWKIKKLHLPQKPVSAAAQ